MRLQLLDYLVVPLRHPPRHTSPQARYITAGITPSVLAAPGKLLPTLRLIRLLGIPSAPLPTFATHHSTHSLLLSYSGCHLSNSKPTPLSRAEVYITLASDLTRWHIVDTWRPESFLHLFSLLFRSAHEICRLSAYYQSAVPAPSFRFSPSVYPTSASLRCPTNTVMAGQGAGPSRRSHTKSRKGCKTCKRRHIRCDETFPQWYVLLRGSIWPPADRRLVEIAPSTRYDAITWRTSVQTPKPSRIQSSRPSSSHQRRKVK